MSFSWQGASGRWYEFDVAKAKRDWPQEGGVYMFVKPSDSPTMEAGGPVTLFVAKTNDMSAALSRHDMWAAALEACLSTWQFIHQPERRCPPSGQAIFAAL